MRKMVSLAAECKARGPTVSRVARPGTRQAGLVVFLF